MTNVDDLMAFIRTELDRDERVARQMVAEPGGFYIEAETDDVNIMTVGAHVYRWTPKRVLDEVRAKRAILELHTRLTEDWAAEVAGDCRTCADPWPCATVLALAQAYAGQPGWDSRWTA